MVEPVKERDCGFNIEDILHESNNKSIQIKRANITSNIMFEAKKDKIDDNPSTSYKTPLFLPINDQSIHYKEPDKGSNNIFEPPYISHTMALSHAPPINKEYSKPTGFGITELLSSKDSFLAKNVVIHDNKSNISEKGMTFLEKLNVIKKDEVNDKECDNIDSSNDKDNSSKNTDDNDGVKLDNTKQSIDNSLIPITTSITGEENEKTIVDISCKLYLFDKDENIWKNIGIVNLHVNEYIRGEDDPKDKFYTRIVARSHTLKRAVLNFKLWPNIVIDLPAENCVLMQAIYMNDIDNIRYISFSIKPPRAREVWKIIKEKINALNGYVEKKSILKECREKYDDYDDMDDDELYDILTYKSSNVQGKRLQLLDSKKAFEPLEEIPSSEDKLSDEYDESIAEDDRIDANNKINRIVRGENDNKGEEFDDNNRIDQSSSGATSEHEHTANSSHSTNNNSLHSSDPSSQTDYSESPNLDDEDDDTFLPPN